MHKRRKELYAEFVEMQGKAERGEITHDQLHQWVNFSTAIYRAGKPEYGLWMFLGILILLVGLLALRILIALEVV